MEGENSERRDIINKMGNLNCAATSCIGLISFHPGNVCAIEEWWLVR